MAKPNARMTDKPLLRVLAGETLDPPPWWLMRQAGRYLPEYRALRARASDFVELCLTPSLAAEATLQPIRRYGMDAAILFSDILLVPRALGQALAFDEGGPRLAPLDSTGGVARLDPAVAGKLAPVGEAVQRVCAALPQRTALIGFAGAPWTVAAYMIEGGTSRDFHRARTWMYRDPVGFAALIDVITESTIAFLALQIAAGVEAVQLFDSWAGVLGEAGFERWVIAPTRRIVEALKHRHPDIPVIGFPRGAGLMYERYVAGTGVTAIGLDTAVPPAFARDSLQPRAAVQGNLDPVQLLVGGDGLTAAVANLRRELGGGPYVFNLGHGVLPETPPDHVATVGRLLAAPADPG